MTNSDPKPATAYTPPEDREVIHDDWCGVPTGRTWACGCNERNGYREQEQDDD